MPYELALKRINTHLLSSTTTEFLLPVKFLPCENIRSFLLFSFEEKNSYFSLSFFQPQPTPPPPPPRLEHSSPKCPTAPHEKHEGGGSGALGSSHSRCPAAGGRFLRRSGSPFFNAAAETFSSSARALVRQVAQSDLARSARGQAPGTHGQRPSHPREPQRRHAGNTRTFESQSRAKCPGRWQRWQITIPFFIYREKKRG